MVEQGDVVVIFAVVFIFVEIQGSVFSNPATEDGPGVETAVLQQAPRSDVDCGTVVNQCKDYVYAFRRCRSCCR